MTRWIVPLMLALGACVGEGEEAADDEAALTARVTVVAVRRREPRVAEVFDDVVTVRDARGRETTFAASTHPWFRNSANATDADGDRVGDVGMLKPGRYRATRVGSHYGAPKYALKQLDGNALLPGWRNTNHDDAYDADEVAASERRGDRLSDILVHAAGPGSLPPIGCQVLSRDDMNALARIAGASFDYELRDAD